jgi:hypothetical protein
VNYLLIHSQLMSFALEGVTSYFDNIGRRFDSDSQSSLPEFKKRVMEAGSPGLKERTARAVSE